MQWRSTDGVPPPGFTFRTSPDLLGRLPVPVTTATGSLSVPAGLSLCSGWHMFGTSTATSQQPAAITLYSPHIRLLLLLLLLHFPVCWSLRKLECWRTDRVCGSIVQLRFVNEAVFSHISSSVLPPPSLHPPPPSLFGREQSFLSFCQ